MEILILLILIFVNALFVMSEIALVSVRKGRLEAMSNKGDEKAKAALEAQRLAELPDEEPKEETVEESTLEDVSDEDTAQQQKEEPKN